MGSKAPTGDGGHPLVMVGVGKGNTQILGLWSYFQLQRLEELAGERGINPAEMKAEVRSCWVHQIFKSNVRF